MKISTKGRYALRLLVDLAEHRPDGYIALKDIAERQGVSKKYLEQIIPLFNRSEILRTNRGYQGGYMLAKEPAAITIGSVLRLTEGGLAPIPCLEEDPAGCERRDICPTLPLWIGLDRVISEYLDGITLQDLLDQQISRQSK
jgi:Rrf2 family protein